MELTKQKRMELREFAIAYKRHNYAMTQEGMDFRSAVTPEVVIGLLDQLDRQRGAILWALGENEEFDPRPDGAGAYWWRTELRKRAGFV